MNLDQKYVNRYISEGTDEPLEIIYKLGNFYELFESRIAIKIRNQYGFTHNWKVLAKSPLSNSPETLEHLAFELLPELLNVIAPFETFFGEHPSVKNKYGFWSVRTQSD